MRRLVAVGFVSPRPSALRPDARKTSSGWHGRNRLTAVPQRSSLIYSRFSDAAISSEWAHLEFVGKIPRTVVSLTSGGRQGITEYWDRPERLRSEAANWAPEPVPSPV